MFISKTDPNAKSLFNRCIKDLNVNDAVWYTCQPLAKRTYSGFMTDLFKQAKCSKIYTAHCLRATAIQTMNDAGHEHRNIMFMTGHKNEASIRSYNHHCSVQPKKFQSATSTRHSHAWNFQTIREYSKLPYTCTVQIIYCFF
jgi:site-specific recombinase XerD